MSDKPVTLEEFKKANEALQNQLTEISVLLNKTLERLKEQQKQIHLHLLEIHQMIPPKPVN
jgi:CHASE3 domain sensor protein